MDEVKATLVIGRQDSGKTRKAKEIIGDRKYISLVDLDWDELKKKMKDNIDVILIDNLSYKKLKDNKEFIGKLSKGYAFYEDKNGEAQNIKGKECIIACQSVTHKNLIKIFNKDFIVQDLFNVIDMNKKTLDNTTRIP